MVFFYMKHGARGNNPQILGKVQSMMLFPGKTSVKKRLPHILGKLCDFVTVTYDQITRDILRGMTKQ